MRQPMVWVVLTLVMTLGSSASRAVHAQELAAASYQRGPRFLLATATNKVVPVDVSRTPVLTQRLSLELEGATLKSALAEIASRAGLRLAYSDDVVPLGRRVHLRAEAITAAAALTDVLIDAGVDIVFKSDGSAALVKRPPAFPAQTATIVGRVTDKRAGAALAGATVVIDGTSRSTTTGNDGRYRITAVAPGTYTLRARYIGYAPGAQSVTVSADQEATADFALEHSTQLLSEVVTTGTVVPTEVRAAPVPVSVITAKEIEALQVRRTDQLFRQAVPSALAPDMGFVTEQTAMSLRGAASLDPFSGTVKVYLDGVEIADRGLAAIDPNTIERIEVIRGPQAATIYGSEAIGGVMQIFTKRGDSTLTRPSIEGQAALGAVQSQFEGSGALRQEYRASLRGGSATTSYHVGVGYSRVGDWVPDYSLSSPSVSGGLRLVQGPLTLDFSGRYYTQRWDRPFDPRLAATGYFYFTTPQFERDQTAEETYGARLGYTPRSWWRHSLTVGIDRVGSDGHNTRNRPGFFPGDDSIRSVNVSNQRKASIAYNTSVTAPLGRASSATVTAGFDHYVLKHDRFFTFHALNVDGTIETTPDDPVVATREATTNTGYFGQLLVNLHDALFLTGGLRVEQNSNFGDALGTPVSPRVGGSFVHTFGGTTVKLRASYGEAIRPPSAGLKTEFRSPFGVQLANPLLGPERQTGVDGGVDLAFGQWGALSVTYYDQTARDLLQSVDIDFAANPPTSQYQNVGRVKNRGIEVEGTLRLASLQLSAQYAYTRSRVDDLGPSYAGDQVVGDQVFGVPRHTAGATLTVTPLPRTSLALGAPYVGGRTNTDRLALLRCVAGTGPCPTASFREFLQDSPAFVKATLSVNRQFTPALGGFLSVENLTNTNANEIDNASLVQGRITMVGARVTW